VIEVRGVGKRFTSRGTPIEGAALDDVTFAVPRGQALGIVGPGAAGKSVLLKMVAGLVRPDVGQVHVDGASLTVLDESSLSAARLRVGMLFQHNALFDFMDVGDNVAFPLRRTTRLAPAEIDLRVADRLARVGLAGFERRLPSSLSGGQRKRVGIARATITEAPVRLYDEPAAGLDPVSAQKIFDLLRREQRAAGATAILVSSDVDRLLTAVDRLVLLVRGRVAFDGTVDEARATEDPHVRQFLQGGAEGPL
jgi:phospholipid/cholesterol/gamma-HCH transport system ATP-binding protein